MTESCSHVGCVVSGPRDWMHSTEGDVWYCPNHCPDCYVPMSKRPSFEARMRLFAQAGVSASVKDLGRNTVECDVAEWFMARARREFVAALYADAVS